MARRIAFGRRVSLKCMLYLLFTGLHVHVLFDCPRFLGRSVLTSNRVITDPKDVEILYQDSADHNKAHQANAGWLLTQLLGSGLGLINAPRWNVLRKTLDPMFSHRTAVRFLHESFYNGAEEYVAGIHRFALPVSNQESKQQKGVVINATQALQRYPFFEVASMFYGKMGGDEQERLWDLGRRYSQVFAAIVAGGIHRTKFTKYLGTKAYQDARDYQRLWKGFNADVYEARKSSAPETLIVLLMEAAERGELTGNEV